MIVKCISVSARPFVTLGQEYEVKDIRWPSECSRTPRTYTVVDNFGNLTTHDAKYFEAVTSKEQKKTNMKVKYNANPRFYPYSTLTKGRVYEVVGKYKIGRAQLSGYMHCEDPVEFYTVVNDRGDKYDYCSEVFDEVVATTNESLEDTIAELEQKLADLKAERERNKCKNVFYKAYKAALDNDDFEDAIDTALVSVTDVISDALYLPLGIALNFYDGDDEKTTGIRLDSDYDWSIVQNRHGQNILICKER